MSDKEEQYNKNERRLKELKDRMKELNKQPTHPYPYYIQPYGWICPICGMANSPWSPSCPCRTKYEVTC